MTVHQSQWYGSLYMDTFFQCTMKSLIHLTSIIFFYQTISTNSLYESLIDMCLHFNTVFSEIYEGTFFLIILIGIMAIFVRKYQDVES